MAANDAGYFCVARNRSHKTTRLKARRTCRRKFHVEKSRLFAVRSRLRRRKRPAGVFLRRRGDANAPRMRNEWKKKTPLFRTIGVTAMENKKSEFRRYPYNSNTTVVVWKIYNSPFTSHLVAGIFLEQTWVTRWQTDKCQVSVTETDIQSNIRNLFCNRRTFLGTSALLLCLL